MFSGDLYRIGLYTPLWSESNPPTVMKKKFHCSRQCVTETQKCTKAPSHFAIADKNSGPSASSPQHVPARHRGRNFTSDRLDHGNFSVNQVERDFIPFRSMLEPSHTANAMGTEAPALNWVSLASPVSSERFTTTRQVGPVYPPPLREPDGSQTPLPITS